MFIQYASGTSIFIMNSKWTVRDSQY